MKLILLLILLSATFVDQMSLRQDKGQTKNKQGKELFDKNCAACHNPKKQSLASPFPFVRQKYGREWVYQIIKNNYRLRLTDQKARRLFINKTNMPIYETSLTNKNINDICDYVDEMYRQK